METKVLLRNARDPLLPRPRRGPGCSERWDREAHTRRMRRSAEHWCEGECDMRIMSSEKLRAKGNMTKINK